MTAAVAAFFVTLVGASPTYAQTTKLCGTGGASYTTDSMYVTRNRSEGSLWTYYMERSPNRSVYNPGDGLTYYHTATQLRQSDGAWMYYYNYPASTKYMYSTSPYNGFKITYLVSNSNQTLYTYKSCSIQF